jgi:chlorite dismutase
LVAALLRYVLYGSVVDNREAQRLGELTEEQIRALPTVAFGQRTRQNDLPSYSLFQVEHFRWFGLEVKEMSSDKDLAGATRGALRLAPSCSEVEEQKAKLPRQYVNFTFYNARPEWRLLSQTDKQRCQQEFIATLDQFRKSLLIHSYSTVGLRTNVDFMIWRIGYDLEPIQEMTARLNKTEMAKYIEPTQSFLSMTKRSMYIDKDNPEHVEDRLHIIPGKSQYLFVYPFVKTREWYVRSAEQRQEMMDEHIRIGSKYRSVKLHTTYSFGLDDQEFVVAFETDYPADFLDLVQELRETKASSYTLRDTPMFTCRQRTISECLDALG